MFTALGVPAVGTTIVDIIQDPANLAILIQSPSFEAPIRKISLWVVKGRNLVAKDRRGLFSKKGGSSDPFVKIKFKKHKLTSDIIEKTLNPPWNMNALELGYVMESESKAVKITVWDYDKMSGKDFMGAIRLPAAGLYAAGPGLHQWWIPLAKGKKSKYHSCKVSGEIFVEVTVKEASPAVPQTSQYAVPQHVINPGVPPAAVPQGYGWPPQQAGAAAGYLAAQPPQPGAPQGYPQYPPQGQAPPGAYPPMAVSPPGGNPGYPSMPGAPPPQGQYGWPPS